MKTGEGTMSACSVRINPIALGLVTVALVMLVACSPLLGIDVEQNEAWDIEDEATARAAQTQADLQTEVAAATARHRVIQTEDARARTEEAAGDPGDEQDEHLTGTITYPDDPSRAIIRNEIILDFSTQDGKALGTINLEYDLDYTSYQGPCFVKVITTATLAGVYAPDTNRLEGTWSGLRTGAPSADICKTIFGPAQSSTGTWEGNFDPHSGKAAGEFTRTYGGGSEVLPFEASRAP